MNFPKLVELTRLSELLGVPLDEVKQILEPYSAVGGTVMKGATLWRLITAAAQLDADSIEQISRRWEQTKLRRYRTQVNISQRLRIIERDGSTCRYCGRKLPQRRQIVIDHVIPWSLGGRNTDDNLVVACRPCNIKKGSRALSESDLSLLPPAVFGQRDPTTNPLLSDRLVVYQRRSGDWVASFPKVQGRRPVVAPTREELVEELYRLPDWAPSG